MANTVSLNPLPGLNDVSREPSGFNLATLFRRRRSKLLNSPPRMTFCGPTGTGWGVVDTTATRLRS